MALSVEAVVVGGLSRNAAAKRFGVSIASAVRWLPLRGLAAAGAKLGVVMHDYDSSLGFK